MHPLSQLEVAAAEAVVEEHVVAAEVAIAAVDALGVEAVGLDIALEAAAVEAGTVRAVRPVVRIQGAVVQAKAEALARQAVRIRLVVPTRRADQPRRAALTRLAAIQYSHEVIPSSVAQTLEPFQTTHNSETQASATEFRILQACKVATEHFRAVQTRSREIAEHVRMGLEVLTAISAAFMPINTAATVVINQTEGIGQAIGKAILAEIVTTTTETVIMATMGITTITIAIELSLGSI